VARPKRKIVVFIATSADGYIARPDGNVDWLNQRTKPSADYGMKAFFRSIDTILWGRKTYHRWLKTSGGPSFGPKVRNFVFSRKPPKSAAPSFEFVREPIPDFAKRLRAEPGKNIGMMGGGSLIASFLDAGEIDEFKISVVPVFIGQGIPLIQPSHREAGLALVSCRRYAGGVVGLHYMVSR
jgi:dihydrofolate reductase